MTVYEALAHCPDLILVHISTFEVRDEDVVPDQKKSFWYDMEKN